MSLASGQMIPVGEGQILKLNFPALTATCLWHAIILQGRCEMEAWRLMNTHTVEWKALDPSCFSLNQLAWALPVPLFSCSLLLSALG